eukprot:GHVU01050584.1.p1 GENE.GHVU01050584.1~~GHVU01050584.1.p1  ORF type:complete len:178 (-),score=22.10 GHVU01050584.1:140-673(-)
MSQPPHSNNFVSTMTPSHDEDSLLHIPPCDTRRQLQGSPLPCDLRVASASSDAGSSTREHANKSGKVFSRCALDIGGTLAKLAFEDERLCESDENFSLPESSKPSGGCFLQTSLPSIPVVVPGPDGSERAESVTGSDDVPNHPTPKLPLGGGSHRASHIVQRSCICVCLPISRSLAQ